MNYKVKPVNGPLHIVTEVPGSKSITNRALLMAAISKGKTKLTGVLFSDDSRAFLGCLKDLGFEVFIDEETKTVVIEGKGGAMPKSSATVFVGSAGTAARFITAMLALSDGVYTITATEQMSKRPMKALFEALMQMGAEFEYLGEEYHLPVRIKGNADAPRKVDIDISQSTQFLSALLMISPMLKNGLTIDVVSEKKTGSYINITRRMMEEFGCKTEFNGQSYIIEAGNAYERPVYNIEPDMSAASYFYAMAAVTGGSAVVKNIFLNSMQGDLKFLGVLEKMGCTIKETAEGVELTGPEKLNGVDVDMNDFSDQTMTLAAIAPYASSATTIRNIAHISLQESDRLHGILNELTRMGIECAEIDKGITINPGQPHSAVIETYEDHRMAMAFAITGLKADGIEISNPGCCRKTFENYFEVFEKAVHNGK